MKIDEKKGMVRELMENRGSQVEEQRQKDEN